MILILIGLTCYFLPTIVAGVRDKANGAGGVFFVNLLLGWTLIGWLVAVIWACPGTTENDKHREEELHRELLEAARGNQPVLIAAPAENVEPSPFEQAAARRCRQWRRCWRQPLPSSRPSSSSRA